MIWAQRVAGLVLSLSFIFILVLLVVMTMMIMTATMMMIMLMVTRMMLVTRVMNDDGGEDGGANCKDTAGLGGQSTAC